MNKPLRQATTMALRWRFIASSRLQRHVVDRVVCCSVKSWTRHPIPAHASPFSSNAAATEEKKQQEESAALSFHSPKVEELFHKMTALEREELDLIGKLTMEKLGIKIIPGELLRKAKGGAAAAEGEGQEEQVTEEKTAFDLKLTGFEAKSKIKVIKEVRAIAGLGLKEAKELVEGAPKVVKTGLKKEEADELKEKLEAIGATVEVA